MMAWFKKFFQVKNEDFVCSVLINKIHFRREKVVQNYWSKFLKLPPSQFRKTIFAQPKQVKTYDNYNNYFGTLRLRILKSTSLSYKINGLMDGLLQAKFENL